MVRVAAVLAVYVSEMMCWHDADISYLFVFGRCIFASVVGCVGVWFETGLGGKCRFVPEAGMAENEAGMMPSMTNVLVYTYR